MELYFWLITFIIVAGIISVIVVRYESKVKVVKPDPEPEPRVVDGIAIGRRTYADLELNKCVNVLKVEDGYVYFEFTGQERVPGEESMFMKNEQFLVRFFRTPNGCKQDLI